MSKKKQLEPYESCEREGVPLDDPMMACPLSQEDIEEFKVIMKSECGEELSDQDAWNLAMDLIGLYRMLEGPIPEDPERDLVPKPQEVTEAAPPTTPRIQNATKEQRGQQSLGL